MSATGSDLTRWVKSAVDLVMTFLNAPELTIPWSVMNSIASPNYEVYKDDIVEAWAALSPVTCTIYVKEGTSFKAITNSEFGELNIKSFSLLKFYWLLLFERQMRKIHYSYAVLLFSSGQVKVG